MEKPIFFEEQDVLSTDLDFGENSTEAAVENRSKDLFGVGGFISGAVVTPTVGFEGTKVDISAAVLYDARGRRMTFTTQVGVPLINIVGGPNYVLVSVPNFQDTNVTNPVYGNVEKTRQHDTFNIEVKATFVQGDTDIDGNPFVVIALVTSNGISEQITDLRNMVKNLSVNTVDTDQIVNHAVITQKLADYLKPIFWQVVPDIYWSRDTQTLEARVVGTFNLTGLAGLVTMAGFPLSVDQPTTTKVIIGTITGGGPYTCTVSAVAITDTSTLAKTNIVVLGYVDTDGSFIRLQAPGDDELFLLTEEEFNSGSERLKANENMWRRGNEHFQSFNPNTLDGVPVTIPNVMNQVTISGGTDLVVAAGVAFVAGRRFQISAPITLDATNTENFSILTGTAEFDIYLMRTSVISLPDYFRFRVVARDAIYPTAPAAGYKLGTVQYTASSPTSIIDRRNFSPNPEVSIISGTAQNVKVGARLKNTTEPADIGVKIIVEPGIVGFADGTTRQNSVSKVLDFTATFDTGMSTTSLPTGQLQTQQGGSPTGLEPFSHYAIFAVADHDDLDFNILAVKVPFFRSVTGVDIGGGQYQYTIGAPGNFPVGRQMYVGQRIRATRADYTPPQYSGGPVPQNPALTQFTNDHTNPEVINSIVGSVVTTTRGATAALVGFSGGTLTSLDKFRPDPTLTGISKRFRLLGFIHTDGTTVPNTVIRIFHAEGNEVELMPGANLNEPNGKTFALGTSAQTPQSHNLDMSNFIPVTIKDIKYKGVVGFDDTVNVGFYAYPNNIVARGFVDIGSPTDTTNLYRVAQLGLGYHSGIVFMGNFAGRIRTYMGFVYLKITALAAVGNDWIYNQLGFCAIGYTFDVKNEWALQTGVAASPFI